MINEREAQIIVNGQEPRQVVIIDNDEDFRSGEGKIPNHDKVEIIYIASK